MKKLKVKVRVHMTKRDKKEVFQKLASARMTQMKKIFKLFRNLSNVYNYDYSEADYQKMIAEIDGEVSVLKSTFLTAMKKRSAMVAKPDPISELVVATESIISEAADDAVTQSEPVEEPEPTKGEPIFTSHEIDDSDVPDFLKKKTG